MHEKEREERNDKQDAAVMEPNVIRSRGTMRAAEVRASHRGFSVSVCVIVGWTAAAVKGRG
jgi:hypothetical protein